MLRPVRMDSVYAYAHADYLDNVLYSMGEIGTFHIVNIRESLKEFKGRLQTVEGSEKLSRVSTLLSRVDALIGVLKIPNKLEHRVKVEKFLSDEDMAKLDERLHKIESANTDIQGQLSDLEKAEEKTHEIEKKIDQLKKELKELEGKEAEGLLVAKEQLEIMIKIEETKTLIGKTDHTYVIKGWVPEPSVDKTLKAIKKASDGNCAFEYQRAGLTKEAGHGEKAEEHMPPSLLNNPKIAKPVEALTTSFGVPNYNEIDPSIIMVFSFPLIFGLMFGDVGHGLVLFLAGTALYISSRKNAKAGEMMSYFIKGAPLLILCGISAIIFGFLYNEFFGPSGMVELIRAQVHSIGLTIPYWFSPSKQPMLLLKYCIYIAIIHISSGLILSLINNLMNKRFKEAIAGPILWLWLYGGISYLFITYGSKMLTAVFNPNIMFQFILLPFLVMLIVRSKLHGIEGLIEALESLIASISNTISYARILALNLAHAIFSEMALLGTGAFLVVSFVSFTFLILTLEAVVTFMHTFRLHLIEWFLKFYSGTGTPYQPFIVTRNFTTV